MVWFFVVTTSLFVLLGGLYWRWRRQIEAEIEEGAAFEWAHLTKTEPGFVTGISEEAFRKIYARVHTPRFPGYALAAGATFFASLPVTFGVLTGILLGAERLGATPQTADVANRFLLDGDELKFFKSAPPEAALYYLEDLAGFYYFFGVIIVWLVIVAFYMRRYHARRPGYLRDEIIRSRQKET